MAHPLKFRTHVLSVREKEGLTIKATAERFSIGVASIVRWLNKLEPRPSPSNRRKVDLESLRQDVEDYPDAYQHERAKRFGVAKSSIW